MFQFWEEVIRTADGFMPPPNVSRKKKTSVPGSERRKRTVLIVDDERLIADTMKEIFNLAGFYTLCAYNGPEALELLAKATPDYVITDVVMPVMNGVDLAIEIQKRLPTTQILLLSGQAGITDLLERGRQLGYSFELLAKPIHPEKLIARLKKK